MEDKNKYETYTPYMIPGSSEPLRHLSYPEEQLEHAIRRAEDEGEEVPVLQGDKDMGSAQVERGKEVLPGMRTVPLVRAGCSDKEGSDIKMESAKELHIEALIEDELDRIVAKHGLFNSDHEAWAVIKEELEEVQEDMSSCRLNHGCWWDMIRADIDDTLDLVENIEKYSIEAIKELVQVIACCRKWKQGHLKDWVEKKAVKV